MRIELDALFLKVLVVFQRTPAAAPAETVTKEEAVAEIVGGDLVGEYFTAVNVRATGGWLYEQGAVRITTDTGIVEGVDVDGQP